MRQIEEIRPIFLHLPAVLLYNFIYKLTSISTNMDKHEKVNSEVAQILARIQAEYEPEMCGLSGLAFGTAKHQFIPSRMERIGQLHAALCEIVGDDDAIGWLSPALFVKALAYRGSRSA